LFLRCFLVLFLFVFRYSGLFKCSAYSVFLFVFLSSDFFKF